MTRRLLSAGLALAWLAAGCGQANERSGGGAGPEVAEAGARAAARVAYDRALEALRNESNKEAVEHLREAAMLDPSWSEAWRLLGHCAASVTDLRTAVDAEEHLLALDPRDAEAAALLADLALRLGDLQLCTRGLFALEQVEPDEGRTHLLLARHAFESGKLDKADAHARRAVKADDTLSLAYHISAVAAEERGETGQAATLYRKALRANPGHLGARDRLATLLARQGQAEDAARHRAIHAALSLATAGAYRNRPAEQRLRDFEQVVELVPEWGRGQLELGRALLERGRKDEALAALERSTELEPTSEAHRLLAQLLREKQRHQAADLHEARAQALAAGEGR